MLEARVHSLTDGPCGCDWSRATPEDFFFSRDFLDVMHASRVEDADYRLVLLRRDGSPRGAAVLTRFTLALDLLSGDPWVRSLRRWLPSALDASVICCGIPASFGQHSLHVIDGGDRDDAFRLTDGAAEAWAQETGAGVVLWKEWSPDQQLASVARKMGYLVLPTLPDHVVGPLPDTPAEFVGRMRSAYRRKYRRAIALTEHGQIDGICMSLEPFTQAHVESFHRGYRAVMDRIPIRLQLYPRPLFSALAESPLEPRLLTLRNLRTHERLSALLHTSGSSLFFLLVSKERAWYGASLYTLLLQTAVLVAIREGLRFVRLGQTSGYSKVSVGAHPRRLETFIRLRSPVKHRILERFGHHLFPEVDSPRLRVFLDDSTIDPLPEPEPHAS